MNEKILLLSLAGFCSGFVDAVAGGGGLISLPAFLAAGVPPTMALGTNKLVGIATAGASSLRYRKANLFSFRNLTPFLLLGVLASGFGAFMATKIRPDLLRPLILVLLIAVGIFILLKNKFGLEEHQKPYSKWVWFWIPMIAFYDGFFGPGTGTFLMMVFVLVGGEVLLNASAKSRLVNFSSNLGALLFFGSTGHINYTIAFPAAVASFIGGILGAQFALTKGVKLIRPVFICVTWGLIMKIAYDFFR